MDFGLKQKRALVCASSQGLGKAIALGLAEEGAHLFLCARSTDTLKAVAQECLALGAASVETTQADLSKEVDRNHLIESILKHWPEGPQVVVHNVGGPRPCKMDEATVDDWRGAFEQLFVSVVHLNHAFLPKMKEHQWGRILTITSTSAFEPIPGLALSSGLRPGITAMSKAWADEVAPYNITMNCIAPGYIYTARTEQRVKDFMDREGGTKEEHLKRMSGAIPAGRMGDPKELASAAVYLCSDAASYVTGTTLLVDGSRTRKSV
jgi:3-oxoacyl-[acyl-carrier protein] reductase